MRLRLALPTRIEVDARVVKILFEAENGSHCFLPRHVDFAAALAPGLLTYETEEGEEVFVAVDGGTVVKQGDEVLVSTPRAVRGRGLGELERAVRERFQVLDERQQKARTALAKMEADTVRRFMEWEEHARE